MWGDCSLGACLEEALGIGPLEEGKKAKWGWEETGLPENLADFTFTVSPPQGAPVRIQGSSSALAGRGAP